MANDSGRARARGLNRYKSRFCLFLSSFFSVYSEIYSESFRNFYATFGRADDGSFSKGLYRPAYTWLESINGVGYSFSRGSFMEALKFFTTANFFQLVYIYTAFLVYYRTMIDAIERFVLHQLPRHII